MRFLAVCFAATTVAIAAVILASTRRLTPAPMPRKETKPRRIRAVPVIRGAKSRERYPVQFSLN